MASRYANYGSTRNSRRQSVFAKAAAKRTTATGGTGAVGGAGAGVQASTTQTQQGYASKAQLIKAGILKAPAQLVKISQQQQAAKRSYDVPSLRVVNPVTGSLSFQKPTLTDAAGNIIQQGTPAKLIKENYTKPTQAATFFSPQTQQSYYGIRRNQSDFQIGTQSYINPKTGRTYSSERPATEGDVIISVPQPSEFSVVESAKLSGQRPSGFQQGEFTGMPKVSVMESARITQPVYVQPKKTLAETLGIYDVSGFPINAPAGEYKVGAGGKLIPIGEEKTILPSFALPNIGFKATQPVQTKRKISEGLKEIYQKGLEFDYSKGEFKVFKLNSEGKQEILGTYKSKEEFNKEIFPLYYKSLEEEIAFKKEQEKEEAGWSLEESHLSGVKTGFVFWGIETVAATPAYAALPALTPLTGGAAPFIAGIASLGAGLTGYITGHVTYAWKKFVEPALPEKSPLPEKLEMPFVGFFKDTKTEQGWKSDIGVYPTKIDWADTPPYQFVRAITEKSKPVTSVSIPYLGTYSITTEDVRETLLMLPTASIASKGVKYAGEKLLPETGVVTFAPTYGKDITKDYTTLYKVTNENQAKRLLTEGITTPTEKEVFFKSIDEATKEAGATKKILEVRVPTLQVNKYISNLGVTINRPILAENIKEFSSLETAGKTLIFEPKITPIFKGIEIKGQPIIGIGQGKVKFKVPNVDFDVTKLFKEYQATSVGETRIVQKNIEQFFKMESPSGTLIEGYAVPSTLQKEFFEKGLAARKAVGMEQPQVDAGVLKTGTSRLKRKSLFNLLDFTLKNKGLVYGSLATETGLKPEVSRIATGIGVHDVDIHYPTSSEKILTEKLMGSEKAIKAGGDITRISTGEFHVDTLQPSGKFEKATELKGRGIGDKSEQVIPEKIWGSVTDVEKTPKIKVDKYEFAGMVGEGARKFGTLRIMKGGYLAVPHEGQLKSVPDIFRQIYSQKEVAKLKGRTSDVKTAKDFLALSDKLKINYKVGGVSTPISSSSPATSSAKKISELLSPTFKSAGLSIASAISNIISSKKSASAQSAYYSGITSPYKSPSPEDYKSDIYKPSENYKYESPPSLKTEYAYKPTSTSIKSDLTSPSPSSLYGGSPYSYSSSDLYKGSGGGGGFIAADLGGASQPKQKSYKQWKYSEWLNPVKMPSLFGGLERAARKERKAAKHRKKSSTKTFKLKIFKTKR